jgi:hypothetical protein
MCHAVHKRLCSSVPAALPWSVVARLLSEVAVGHLYEPLRRHRLAWLIEHSTIIITCCTGALYDSMLTATPKQSQRSCLHQSTYVILDHCAVKVHAPT